MHKYTYRYTEDMKQCTSSHNHEPMKLTDGLGKGAWAALLPVDEAGTVLDRLAIVCTYGYIAYKIQNSTYTQCNM